jgi:hypothetical protein
MAPLTQKPICHSCAQNTICSTDVLFDTELKDVLIRGTFSLCLKDQFKSKLQKNKHNTISSVGAKSYRVIKNVDSNFPFQW